MQSPVCCIYHETNSPATVQRRFRNEYGRNQAHIKSIKNWYPNFKETGSDGDLERTGRSSISEETTDTVRNVTAPTIYLDILELYITRQLEEFHPLVIFQQYIFQHLGLGFLQFLNANFPTRWIEKDRSALWPPFSLDLS